MKMQMQMLMAAVLGTLALPAAAACSWEWLCNGEGQCKHMPVCDSVYENPGPAPEGAARPPAPPPTAMRPHKIAGGSGVTASTLTCEHIMRQGKSGRWTWHEACFCSDPTKTKDPSTPFANIVRCEGR